MIVASIKSGYNDTSKSKSWKVPETVLSLLKYTTTEVRAKKALKEEKSA